MINKNYDRHPRLVRGSRVKNLDSGFCPRYRIKCGMTTSLKSAFTLIEISIVLVIIGIVIGGFVVGQSLIRSSEVRSIVSDYEKFKAALNNFEQKYAAIPGDMDNATTFWGSSGPFVDQTTLATQNGDGNSLIDVDNGAIDAYEAFLFWKHLANAELIEGNFIGTKTPGQTSTSATSNRNVPSGKIIGSLWFTHFWGTKIGDYSYFDGAWGNMMYIGKSHIRIDPITLIPSLIEPITPVITVSEMSAMDIKMDDGKPGTGNLRSRVWTPIYGHECAVLADGVTMAYSDEADIALYNRSATGDQCTPIFTNMF